MRQLFYALGILLCGTTNLAYAIDRIDLSIGNITRPSSTSPLLNNFTAAATWDTDFLKSDEGFIKRSVRIEAGVGYHKTDDTEVKSAILAPVLHYQLATSGAQPFFEISTGIAYISETLWEAHDDLSSHAMFSDRIGVGYAFGETEISLNFAHFSNAGLRQPNPGADMLQIRASFKL